MSTTEVVYGGRRYVVTDDAEGRAQFIVCSYQSTTPKPADQVLAMMEANARAYVEGTDPAGDLPGSDGLGQDWTAWKVQDSASLPSNGDLYSASALYVRDGAVVSEEPE